jgi:hypothetical protein
VEGGDEGTGVAGEMLRLKARWKHLVVAARKRSRLLDIPAHIGLSFETNKRYNISRHPVPRRVIHLKREGHIVIVETEDTKSE